MKAAPSHCSSSLMRTSSDDWIPMATLVFEDVLNERSLKTDFDQDLTRTRQLVDREERGFTQTLPSAQLRATDS